MRKEELTYKVQEILKNLEKYNELNINIKSSTKEFDIVFANRYNPHLLGLPYITERKNINGMKLYNYIFENNLSDKEILKRIKKFHGQEMKENVEKRINTFEEFLNNLDKGIIVEKTLKGGKMNVNYLIIQNKKEEFYHLGIMSSSNGALLVDFENIEDKREKDILKTYFIENNKDYFKETKIIEPVESIEKYDEEEKRYIPFSFDEVKNRELLEKFYKEKTENKTTEKKVNIPKKEINQENEFER